jgi:hypothetical protein
MTAIALNKAYWCENCSSVIDTPIACPHCATTHNIIPLANWMEPKEEQQIEVQAIVGA